MRGRIQQSDPNCLEGRPEEAGGAEAGRRDVLMWQSTHVPCRRMMRGEIWPRTLPDAFPTPFSRAGVGLISNTPG